MIEKSCYSAFVGTDVELELRQRGIRTLVFAGVQTNVCVESSLRDAVCRGFHAVLASDCVASHTLPLHEATLNNVRFLFGDVLDRAAIMAELAGRGEGRCVMTKLRGNSDKSRYFNRFAQFHGDKNRGVLYRLASYTCAKPRPQHLEQMRP